eukprot:TRINITY_DN6571_c2_g1_i2.p1 TRINITY_DN6571_c2_g1~~TRINITY_DN6571_c2_g1_i2.p1  ORF type:complete len:775 (+),score=184.85 TRINITY_DN6571_c2_g1_i2:71-2326(+)
MGLLQELVVPILRDEDTAEQRAVKRVVVPAYVLGCALSILAAVVQAMSGVSFSAYNVGIVYLTVVGCTVLGYVYSTLTFPKRLAEGSLVALAFGMVILDWGQAAGLRNRTWPIVVIIMDLLLAISASRPTQLGVMHGTLLWLCVDMIESSARLGLYDIPVWTDTDHSQVTAQCSCADPPCALSVAYTGVVFGTQLLTLYADYVATRGFAEGQRREAQSVLASVLAAEQVASCLARFDLESAERALLDCGDQKLPERLSGSLEQLLGNLARYRPYLPASVFAESGQSGSNSPDGPSGRSSPATSVVLGWVEPDSEPGELAAAVATAAAEGASGRPPGDRRTSVATETTARTAELSREVSNQSSLAMSRILSHIQNWHLPQQQRVTLLASNRRNFLSTVSRVEGLLQGWIEQEVEYFWHTVSALQGVVDLLSADHFSASFGAAVKLLGTHRSSAVRCAARLHDRPPPATAKQHNALTELAQSTAVCSGRALCGDFGSFRAQRYMIIGSVGSVIHALERAATVWHVNILLDDNVQSDAAGDWDCRVRALALFGRRGKERPLMLWEIVQEKPKQGPGPQEWMYELATVPPNPWADYNAAVRCWCAGQPAAALEAVEKGIAADVPATPAARSVRIALAAVRESIHAGAAPPVVRLSVAQRTGAAPTSAPQSPVLHGHGAGSVTDCSSSARQSVSSEQPHRRERSVVFSEDPQPDLPAGRSRPRQGDGDSVGSDEAGLLPQRLSPPQSPSPRGTPSI